MHTGAAAEGKSRDRRHDVVVSGRACGRLIERRGVAPRRVTVNEVGGAKRGWPAVKEIAFNEAQRETVLGGVARGHGEGVGIEVEADKTRDREGVPDRESETAAADSDIGEQWSAFAGGCENGAAGDHGRYEMREFGVGDVGAFVDGEGEATKAERARDVSEGFSAQAAFQPALEAHCVARRCGGKRQRFGGVEGSEEGILLAEFFTECADDGGEQGSGAAGGRRRARSFHDERRSSWNAPRMQ